MYVTVGGSTVDSEFFLSYKHFESALDYTPDANERTKMSKSSGTAVSVDNVVRGVQSTVPGFHFAAAVRLPAGLGLVRIPAGFLNIWRDPANGQYFTGPPFGKTPVFLMRDTCDVPCWLSDIEDYQHKSHVYWRLP